MMYYCCDTLRREETRQSPLNGIDFLEVIDIAAPVEADRQRFLHVHLLKDPAPVTYAADQVVVSGPAGTIEVLDVVTGLGPQANVLVVELLGPGDFEPHSLSIIRGPLDQRPPAELDPQLASVSFSFKVECPSDFDCISPCDCPSEPRPLPEISYLARDYERFRQLILDRVATLQPGFEAPHVADQRMALIEALAVAADNIAYQQDASHSEAYLMRLQDRISARRLVLLVDYAIGEGRNARTFVHIEVDADADPIAPDFEPVIPTGTALTTRIGRQPVRLPGDPALLEEAAVVFETMMPLTSVFRDHVEIDFYTWSDQRCCLPAGATEATLAGHFPNLEAGQFLAFEELMSPRTGSEADRDRSNRPVVRLTQVVAFASPGVPLADPVTGDEITRINWDSADALTRPLCISAETDVAFGRRFLPRVSIARGNVVLVDHGRSIVDEALGAVPASTRSWAPGQGPQAVVDSVTPTSCATEICDPPTPERIAPKFNPRLGFGPLTFAAPLLPTASVSALLASSATPQPQITLSSELDGVTEPYSAQRDLLGSGPMSRDVVPEIDNQGRAWLRFGNDVNGLRPNAGTQFTASYRVGLGPLGNIGEDTLVHIRSDLGVITGVRNMTPAVGGQRPETIKEIRRRAPFAFRRQERAVTREDHDEMARRFIPPEGPMQGTVTNVMHSGSWQTFFLTADRSGGLPVTEAFETDLRAHLERYRMAGRDLEVDGPIHVPLEIDMEVCVSPDHLRGQVKAAVLARFSNRVMPDGTLGAFHPDQTEFGKTVYLSPLIALAQSIAGVTAVRVARFQRFSNPYSSGLQVRKLTFGRREIAQLDNDPSHPGRGVFRLTMRGGR